MKAGLLVAMVLAGATPAFADSCDALTAAFLKGLATPWHATTTLTVHGDKRQRAERITLVDKSYFKNEGGAWREAIRDMKDNEVQIRRDWAHSSCRPDGTETIDGDLSDILRHHWDTRFWISRSTGLLVKTEVANKPSVVTTLYDYRDVQAPVK